MEDKTQLSKKICTGQFGGIDEDEIVSQSGESSVKLTSVSANHAQFKPLNTASAWTEPNAMTRSITLKIFLSSGIDCGAFSMPVVNGGFLGIDSEVANLFNRFTIAAQKVFTFNGYVLSGIPA